MPNSWSSLLVWLSDLTGLWDGLSNCPYPLPRLLGEAGTGGCAQQLGRFVFAFLPEWGSRMGPWPVWPIIHQRPKSGRTSNWALWPERSHLCRWAESQPGISAQQLLQECGLPRSLHWLLQAPLPFFVSLWSPEVKPHKFSFDSYQARPKWASWEVSCNWWGCSLYPLVKP